MTGARYIRRLVMAAGILGGLAASSPAAAAPIVGVASVVDADTIEIHGVGIRLHGIDAPESRQLCTRPNGERWRCGQRASLALSDRIGRSTVSFDPRDTNRYGRTIAVCRCRGVDLNGWLVTRGSAVAYRRYSRDYVSAEDRARSASRGVWSGQFDIPREWRAERRGR